MTAPSGASQTVKQTSHCVNEMRRHVNQTFRRVNLAIKQGAPSDGGWQMRQALVFFLVISSSAKGGMGGLRADRDGTAQDLAGGGVG